MINGENKYVSLKEVIVHCRNNATTAKITMTKRCMHLWYEFLKMTNVLVNQSGFRLRGKVSYDSTGFVFYSRFNRRHG